MSKDYKAGKDILVPSFKFRGKLIIDEDNRKGMIKTIIDSKNKQKKYVKVRLFSPIEESLRYVVCELDNMDRLTIPDYPRTHQTKDKETLSFLKDNLPGSRANHIILTHRER